MSAVNPAAPLPRHRPARSDREGRPRDRRASPLDHFARWIALRLLSRTRGGELVVLDGSRRLVFGQRLARSPLSVVLRVHSARFYRQLLRGSVGLGESYVDGLWDCDDLVSLTRLAARNVGKLDRLRRVFAPVLVPVQRWARWLARNTPGALARADRRALRPRQRAVLAVPRPDDDVLVRRLRVAREHARGGVAGQARARLREAQAHARGPRAGDRHRLGRLRAVCRRALRLPRDDHDDLRRAARLRERARARSRPRGSRDGALAGLPRAAAGATTSSSRSR